jgi:hypothetical protein
MVAMVHHRDMATVAEVDSRAETLSRDGIVVIEDYLDADVCDSIYESVVDAAESFAGIAVDDEVSSLVYFFPAGDDDFREAVRLHKSER